MIRIVVSLAVLLFSLKEFHFFRDSIFIDSLFLFITPIVIFSLLTATIFYFSYLTEKEKYLYLLFFFLVSIFIWLSFRINRAFLFLLMFESIIFPIFLLILNFSKSKDKISSLFFIVFFNLAGSLPFIYFSSNILEFVSRPPSSVFLFTDLNFRSLLRLCFIFIFLTKIPIIFLHFWLPKAHGRASGACSIVLARLVLKLGTFGFFKFIRINIIFSYFCRR